MGVGLTEEELVAVLNREMERRRQEEEQRAMEARPAGRWRLNVCTTPVTGVDEATP